jgi:hypothetical protein
MFLQKYKGKQFFCGHNILTEGVFVTQLSSNVGICLTNYVGYDKLPFHERYPVCVHLLQSSKQTVIQ